MVHHLTHSNYHTNVPFLFPKDRQMCNTGRIGYNERNVSLFFNENALDYISEYREIYNIPTLLGLGTRIVYCE